MLDKSKEVIKMSNQKSYPGDMTDAQAELLLSLVPPAKPGGRPRTVTLFYQSWKTVSLFKR
jgi:hypothetical protein